MSEPQDQTNTAEGQSVTTDVVMRLLEETKNKPDKYHHVCGGGSTVHLVDEWTSSPDYTCRRQGKDEYGAPSCKNCKGLTKGHPMLNDREEAQNYILDCFAEKLIAAFGA
jgi:hypothetical protein